MSNGGIRLFISCVSGEFGAYRDALRSALTRANVEVKIQEDFKPHGDATLFMLEDYNGRSEVVVHFVGEMVGEQPASKSVERLLAKLPDLDRKLAKLNVSRRVRSWLSYTQWEAWLGIALGKKVLVVMPGRGVQRGPSFLPEAGSKRAQAEHLSRLKAIDFHPNPPFTGTDNLVTQIMTSAVIDELIRAAVSQTAGVPREKQEIR